MDPRDRLSPEQERQFYETHNNDVDDPRYQAFVLPITSAVQRDFSPDSLGLDFGAGTGPVITKVLQEQGYALKLYDPFFHRDREVLQHRYDYVVCCEVIEHFGNPAQAFAQLCGCLKPGGKLYCMSVLYNPAIDLSTWYYATDPTHVFFYQAATLHWLQQHLGFASTIIEGRLITFTAAAGL